MDQEAGGGAFLQAIALEVPRHFRQLQQLGGGGLVQSRFVADDSGLEFGLGVIEGQGHEALPGRLLEFLQHALVAGVVGNGEAEVGGGLQQLAEFLDGHHAAVVGQGMDHHHGVLARLDDFIQVADAASAHGAGQGPVHPGGLAALDQIAAHQVGGGEVVVAGNGDEGSLEAPGHVFHEAGLAAAGRPLQQHRQAVGVGGLEQGYFIANRFVVGFLGDEMRFGGRLGTFHAAGCRYKEVGQVGGGAIIRTNRLFSLAGPALILPGPGHSSAPRRRRWPGPPGGGGG